MHVRSVSVALGLLLSAAASAPRLALGAEPSQGVQRVLIFDIQAESVSGPEVAELPDLIGQLFMAHPGFTVIPDGEMHRSLSARDMTEPGCATSEACRRAIRRDLHADLVVFGSIGREGKRFVLNLNVDGVKGDKAPRRTSEPMKYLKSLAENVKLCLNRLVQWPEAVPVADAPAPAEPLKLASTPIPPITVEVVTPAPAPARAPVPEPARPAVKPAGSGRKSIALIAVSSGEGVSDRQSRTIEETLLNELSATRRFKVVGRSDIDAVLSLEARKQTAGCSDAECAVQIAGALGVDLVATADVGRLGKNILVTLKLVDVRSASVVSRAQVGATSDDDLPARMRDLASAVVADIWPSALTETPIAVAVEPQHRPGTFGASFAMLGLGAAAAIVAAVAGSTAQRCQTTVETPLGLQNALQCQSTYGTIADVSWAVAGASALTGGVLLFTWIGKGSSTDETKIALSASPNGALVRGEF